MFCNVDRYVLLCLLLSVLGLSSKSVCEERVSVQINIEM